MFELQIYEHMRAVHHAILSIILLLSALVSLSSRQGGLTCVPYLLLVSSLEIPYILSLKSTSIRYRAEVSDDNYVKSDG